MILALVMDSYPDASIGLLIDRLKTALVEDESSSDERVALLEAELTEAREEVSRILKHSHQVQESLEQSFHDEQDKRRLIDEMSEQLAELRRQLDEAGSQQQQVLALEQELAFVKQSLSDKSSQLETVLEELEHYFIQSRKQLIMLKKYEDIQRKSTAIITDLAGR